VSVPGEVAKHDKTIRQHAAILLDHCYRDSLDFIIDRKVLIKRLAKALQRQRYLDAAEVAVALRSPMFNRADDFGDPASADVPWSGIRRMAA